MRFSGNTKVLLVDDNEGDVILISDTIMDLGKNIDIKVLQDGQSTLDFLQSFHEWNDQNLPGLILLDIHLPRINGMEILEYIKGNELLKGIPVVLLTSSSSHQDISQAYGNHVNCFVTKPTLSIDYKKILESIFYFWPTPTY